MEQKNALCFAFTGWQLCKPPWEQDLALVFLEKAFDERNGGLIWLGADPRMDSLRSDPRFAALVERVGVPP